MMKPAPEISDGSERLAEHGEREERRDERLDRREDGGVRRPHATRPSTRALVAAVRDAAAALSACGAVW